MRHAKHAMTIAVAPLVLTAASVFGQVSFQGLGDLEGGYTRSVAFGVSADGRVIVGKSGAEGGDRAFSWTPEDGMISLGVPPGGATVTEAFGVSGDGGVIVGVSTIDDDPYTREAFMWTAAAGMVPLGDLPGGPYYSIAEGVSGDGKVIVGEGMPSELFEGFRWTQEGGFAGLGMPPGGPYHTFGLAASADGAIIAGLAEDVGGSGTFATRWDAVHGTVILPDLPGGDESARAIGISGDGRVIVGRCSSEYSGAGDYEACVWMEGQSPVGLGDLPGGIVTSTARAASADGSVIVGSGRTGDEKEDIHAFVWDEIHGMRDLNTLLPQFGIDLTGWTLRYATGISADGTVIVGYGLSPNVISNEGWRVTLPPPCYADYDGDGMTDLFDFLAFVNAFNAEVPGADCDADEAFDLFDFLCFVNAFNTGC